MPNENDGCINLNELRHYIQEREGKYSEYDQHLYRPQLLCIENPHTQSGGQVLAETYLKAVGLVFFQSFKKNIAIYKKKKKSTRYSSF